MATRQRLSFPDTMHNQSASAAPAGGGAMSMPLYSPMQPTPAEMGMHGMGFGGPSPMAPQPAPTRFQTSLAQSRALDNMRQSIYAANAPTYEQAKASVNKEPSVHLGAAPGPGVAAPEPQTTRRQLPNGGWELTGPNTPAHQELARGQAEAARSAYTQTKAAEAMMDPSMRESIGFQNQQGQQQQMADAAAMRMMQPTPQKPTVIPRGGMMVDSNSGKTYNNPIPEPAAKPTIIPSGGMMVGPDGKTQISNPHPLPPEKPTIIPAGGMMVKPGGEQVNNPKPEADNAFKVWQTKHRGWVERLKAFHKDPSNYGKDFTEAEPEYGTQITAQ